VRPPSAFPELSWSGLVGAGSRGSWGTLARSNEVHLTYSGRGAIYQYLAALKASGQLSARRNVVLVPSFHCPTVVDPALHAGFEVRFFAIDGEMRIDAQDLLHKLDDTVAAVLFIRFFGFAEIDPQLVTACRVAGAKVIEDCCHSFLDANPLRIAYTGADATVFSFWKTVPSLVGGGMLLAEGAEPLPLPACTAVPSHDSKPRVRALARQLIERLTPPRKGPDDSEEGPAIRKPADQAYPYDKAAASWEIPRSSKWILANAPLEDVVAARRRNYALMSATLTSSSHLIPLRKSLAADTVPWGFPVILQKRAERDYRIRSRGVPVFTFGEVLHPLLFTQHQNEREMLDTTMFLSNNVLGFATHQGFSETQIATFASAINGYIATL
jgi:dTDP-4-amino-4,6-dideoxygalactose transaminase